MKHQAFARNTLAIVCIILWASAYVFTRVAIQHFSPASISSLRYLFASLVLLPYIITKRIKLPEMRDLGWFIGSGLTGFTLYVIFFNIGSVTVEASVSSLIVSVSPVISAILAKLFYKERMGWIKWLAFIAAFVGVTLICIGEDGLTINSGIVWILFCPIFTALYIIIIQVLLKRGYEPFQVTAYSIFCGTIFLLPLLPGAMPELIIAPIEQLLPIIYLGVFPTCIAYIGWSYAMSKADKIADVTNYLFVTPVLTFFMGYIGLGETPSAIAFLGGALVMAGVITTNFYTGKSAQKRNSTNLR